MEEENLDNPTVFKTTHAEMKRTAVTQCQNHQWQKLTDNEVYCPVCQSAAIINPNDMEKYVRS
jgi:Zn finger protein HypA/HybF involved in hydrogenase expression